MNVLSSFQVRLGLVCLVEPHGLRGAWGSRHFETPKPPHPKPFALRLAQADPCVVWGVILQ